MAASKGTSMSPSVASTKTASVARSKTVSVAPSKASSVTGDNERAGMTLTKSGVENPNPIRHGKMGQAERAFSAASTFISGIMAISASQFIGAPLRLVDPKFYHAYMAWTKESFAVLVTTITQWWSPTVVRVSGDKSMKDQLYQMDDGTLKCNFPHRLVLMANHQLYTDWMYLWWIAYTNKMHGHIYIILKESLKQLPIFGWGAQFYNFIFLSRKWETDKHRFQSALNRFKRVQHPMWLLIFPEGTNLSEVTRQKSAAWAKKSGVPDMKHQLLPRSTGLQFCLQELKQTTNWLYDCTIAYGGIPHGQYGQDVFTLRSSFFEGRPPTSVNMFWRRFKISEIPMDSNEAFNRWLTNRWREKDYILDYFYKYDHFPEEDATKALLAAQAKRKPKHAKMIETEVKGGGWDEFLSIFGPITSAAGALSSFDMTEPINFDALLGQAAMEQNLDLLKLNKGTIAEASQHFVRNALQAAQNSAALPKPVLKYLMKETPQTQEQMQQAIMTSAKQSGNTQIAKRAAKAPAAKQAMPGATKKDVEFALQERKALDQAQANKRGKAVAAPSLTVSVKKTMPLANMQSAVTRPLTTAAVQTAMNSMQKAAAQNAKQRETTQPNRLATKKANVPAKDSTVVSKAPVASSGARRKVPSSDQIASERTDKADLSSMRKPAGAVRAAHVKHSTAIAHS